MPTEIFFSYRYDDGTDRHLLPADLGAWSLEGLAHAATLTTHFLVEGRVRHRAPYSDKFRVFLAPPREGSWETDFIIAFQSPEVWAGVAAGVTAGLPTLAFKLLRRLSNRATGVPTRDDEAKAIEDQHQGTFDALLEAAEPSLLRAHRVIETNKTTLRFIRGSFSFEFDGETRRYIEANEIDAHVLRAVGNVASYNVNRRTGRIFIDNMGRTVPFVVERNSGPETEVALARSLENYALQRLANSDITIRYRAIRAPDGGVKRIRIQKAEFTFGIVR